MTSSNINDYKDNLLHRIGGPSSFDFLIISYATRIQEDPSLQEFYGNFALKNLIAMQKEFLMVVFLKSDSNIESRIVLRHYQLFQRGLNESHFDTLWNHFAAALCDSWLPDDVLKDCERHFMELRPIFEQHGSSAKKNNLRAETTQRRFSDAMRTQKVMKEVERVCESEEFYSTTTNKVQPKKSRTIRFLQTRNRKV